MRFEPEHARLTKSKARDDGASFTRSIEDMYGKRRRKKSVCKNKWCGEAVVDDNIQGVGEFHDPLE